MKNFLNFAAITAIAALSFSPQAQAQSRAQYEALVASHAMRKYEIGRAHV